VKAPVRHIRLSKNIAHWSPLYRALYEAFLVGVELGRVRPSNEVLRREFENYLNGGSDASLRSEGG
jgi:hypothetical protein